MKAILVDAFGDPDVLREGEAPAPELRPDDLLVRVHASGVNRADILQRQGRYGDNNFGDSPLLGLEIAGRVVGLGSNVDDFAVGQRVFGIVGGGGYAQFARIDRGLAMTIPDRLSYQEAAAVPEVFLTASEALFDLALLRGDQSVLVHAGGSGVGTAAIQLAHHAGVQTFFTAGSDDKVAKAGALGSATGINYRTANFAHEVRKLKPEGVDAVIDFIGAPYLNSNIDTLSEGGRLVLLSVMGGTSAQLDLGVILRRRLSIVGSVIKSRSMPQKRDLTRRFAERWLSLLARGAINPVIDRIVPISQIRAAHRHVEANANFGKVVVDLENWA